MQLRVVVNAAEKAAIASSGLDLAEVLEMPSAELAGSAGEIQTMFDGRWVNVAQSKIVWREDNPLGAQSQRWAAFHSRH